MSPNLTIGKLAEASGVGVETVRFYERKGLITKPTTKSDKSFRTYSAVETSRIRFIKRAQDLGFTLREIKGLLELNSNPKATCFDIKTKADEKITEIEAKIQDLKNMKTSLKKLASACGESKKAASACQITQCFEPGWNC